jgi:hypothetical protein
METKRALEILTALAEGVDPYTGEVYSKDSPYQNADTVRALIHTVEGMKKLEFRSKKDKAAPDKAGKPWSKEEEEALVQEFDSGTDMGEIAKKHMRSQYAIRARLVKLGKLEEDKSFPAYNGFRRANPA